MNKQELIDKAVHHFGGKYPESAGRCRFISLRIGNAGVFDPYYVTYERAEDTICTREEFQQRARELGYGVEAAEPESWYCYETQKALRLPPAGVECEVFNHEFSPHADWENCKLLFGGEFLCVYTSSSAKERVGRFGSIDFRPLDWNRKAEAERKRVVDAALEFFHETAEFNVSESFNKLYDAGYLRLPADKR